MTPLYIRNPHSQNLKTKPNGVVDFLFYKAAGNLLGSPQTVNA